MTFNTLRLFGHQLASTDLSWLDKQVAWVAALWAFWGAARMSGLLTDKLGLNYLKVVSYSRIRVVSPDHITVLLPMPKNRKEQSEVLDLRTFPDQRYCPITQLHKLTDARELLGRVQEADYIFKKSNGTVMTMAQMNALLKATLLPLFPDQPGFWSCHSFRAGLASTMANHPTVFSEEEIKVVGRWNSDAFKAYCRLRGISQEQAYTKMAALMYYY